MKKPRVVITGIGVISPAGIGIASLENVLRKGIVCMETLPFENPDITSRVGAPIPDFNPRDFMSPKEAKRLDRGEQLFASAALMAIDDARIKVNHSGKIGIIQGTSLGGLHYGLNTQIQYQKYGYKQLNPIAILGAMTGSGGAMVAKLRQIHGPSFVVSAGSTSSAQAIITGVQYIKNGELDIVIAGGGEAPLNWQVYLMFQRAKMMASGWNDCPTKACRPFDQKRNGMIPGEAGAVLILERLELAQKRNCQIYAEIIGTEFTTDAFSLIAPEPDGLHRSKAMVNAIQKGNIEAKDIDFISAHGTSTFRNDISETNAIKLAFKKYAQKIPVCAMKSMLGHSLGACATTELIGTILAMNKGFLPPTVNLENPDPHCDLDYIPQKGRTTNINYALINNCSFGGKNSSLLISKFH
ncbi:MAG: beta-ketoacyl-[acyl-carrier-protein] synthase family protein [Saprospiraceae bacterium]|jgi:3-oxoacyl-[acyl-carrier-protein] synthase II|nr:beta-ketoacyl-[acyl-carrier-protein] synthase family protein [Saprospiraceae bacterium]